MHKGPGGRICMFPYSWERCAVVVCLFVCLSVVVVVVVVVVCVFFVFFFFFWGGAFVSGRISQTRQGKRMFL